MNRPLTPIGWFVKFKTRYSHWYASSPRSEANAKPWPPQFDPWRDWVFAHNEIHIPGVPASRVFHLLVRAGDWPKFYENAADVEIQHFPGPIPAASSSDKLRMWSKFRWKTFSAEQKSEVTLFEQDRALGWTADSLGTRAYHRWLLVSEGNGTRVITEECQTGLVAWIHRVWMNPSLHASHQLWLEGLKQAAIRAQEVA